MDHHDDAPGAKRFRGQQPAPLKRELGGVMPDSFALPAAHPVSPAGQRIGGGSAQSSPRPMVQTTMQKKGKGGGRSGGPPADPIAGVEAVIRQIIAASQDAVASSLRAQEVASRALEVARKALEQHELAEQQAAATVGATTQTQGLKRTIAGSKLRPHGTKVLGDLSQAKRKQAHIERWLQAKEMAKKELGYTVSYTQDTPEGKALCARTKRIYNQILAAERQQVTKTKTEPVTPGPSAAVQQDPVATEAVLADDCTLKRELDL